MDELRVLSWVGCLAVFLGIYAVLQRREERRTGTRPPVQWFALAAAIGCAVAAVVLGALLDV